MIKTSYILTFILIFIAQITWAYALSGNQKGAILDNFKKREYDLLFDSTLGDVTIEFTDIFESSNKIGIYEKSSESTKKIREEVEGKKEVIGKKILSLEESINQLDLDIDASTKKINKINANIIDTKNQIQSNTKTVEVLNKKISENMELLLEYLTYIYKKGNTVYDNKEVDNLKSILLNEENIGDVINDLYYNGLIQVTGKKLIDKHRKYISELYIQKLELEKEEEDLKKLRKLGIVEKKLLDDKKSFKQKILDVSKGQESFYEKFVEDKLKEERNLQLKTFKEKVKFNSIRDNILKKYNCEYVDISKQNNDINIQKTAEEKKCLEINRMIYSETQLSNSDTDKLNFFDWPFLPKKGISTFYHEESYTKDFGSAHDAIDIPIEQGTPITAPADGYVVYIAPPVTGDYSYIALKHFNGYLTVYGHISDVFVKEYEFVEKGQVFAQSGGERGTFGAGYLSTGPHLHFEVFKDKEYIDPLTVLDLSYLDLPRLPEKYKFKFYNDFKKRKGYEYKDINANTQKFKLIGSTEIERQKYLIQKYAVGDFNNWQIWIDEALDGNIDPSFVMCVGLAETSLGKHLKTPYNIGNVGNTDSGAVKTFPNARSGIYAMIRTFNNKFLGQYNEINQLSRYGNKNLKKPIYASSPENWHNNIIKCLSHLKGDYVPDNYKFRITK